MYVFNSHVYNASKHALIVRALYLTDVRQRLTGYFGMNFDDFNRARIQWLARCELMVRVHINPCTRWTTIYLPSSTSVFSRLRLTTAPHPAVKFTFKYPNKQYESL